MFSGINSIDMSCSISLILSIYARLVKILVAKR